MLEIEEETDSLFPTVFDMKALWRQGQNWFLRTIARYSKKAHHSSSWTVSQSPEPSSCSSVHSGPRKSPFPWAGDASAFHLSLMEADTNLK